MTGMQTIIDKMVAQASCRDARYSAAPGADYRRRLRVKVLHLMAEDTRKT